MKRTASIVSKEIESIKEVRREVNFEIRRMQSTIEDYEDVLQKQAHDLAKLRLELDQLERAESI